MDVIILDKNLLPVLYVDQYKSVIWAKRYKEVGDCELYLPASAEALAALQMGNYIARLDDNMVCRINYTELTTDAEAGDYLTVKGIDTKGLLDQRVIWGTLNCGGNLEAFIAGMVDGALGSTAQADRVMLKQDGTQLVYQADPQGFGEVSTEQVSYANIGEKVREYCTKYGWGYRMTLDSGKLYFGLYAGADRRDDVVFSDLYENIATTTFSEDETNLGNVALVAGEGEGSDRTREQSGTGASVDRYEVYVDAKDISRNITYGELKDAFSGGTVITSHGQYYYRVLDLDVQIVDAAHLQYLEDNYIGTIVTIGGVEYYEVATARVAELPSSAPADGDTVVLNDIVYTVYLLNRGYEKLAEYGAVTSFEGTIEPNGTFVYKEDYDLGDLVTVQSSYGVSEVVRIAEVVEVNDDNGYRVEPSFERVE